VRTRRVTFLDVGILFAIFFVALAVRIHGLSFQPFWMDEITTIQRASQPLFTIIVQSLTFHHLPAYFILISWIVHFGTGEMLVRLPSAVFSAMTCAVAAATGRVIAGRAAGALSGLFLAFSPAQVSSGQEARPQALAVLLIAIALYGLTKLALDPKSASLPLRDRGANRSGWATYGLATFGAVNVLGIALLWAVVGWLAMLVIATQPGRRKHLLRTSAQVHGAIALLTLPGYAAMLYFVHGYGRLLEGLDWIPPVTIERFSADSLSAYFLQIASPISFRAFPYAIPYMGAIVGVCAIVGLGYLWSNRVVFSILVLATVVLPLSLLSLSALQPAWLLRYLLWSAVPFFIIAGSAMAALPSFARIPAISVILALSFWNLRPYYQLEQKPRWDLAADTIETAIQQHDLILVADVWVPRMMNVYLVRAGLKLSEDEWTSSVDTALARIRDGDRVWVVFGRVGQVDRENLDSFLQRIAPLGPPSAKWSVGLDIVVLLFEPPSKTVNAVTGN
jgi:mannosyltransferase